MTAMTYAQLQSRLTFSVATNTLIATIINRVQWEWPRGDWQARLVSDADLAMVRESAAREGVSF